MRVLVSGGAGFIGSHLVDVLVGLGHKVRVFDNYSTGSAFNLVQAHQRGVRTTTGSVASRPDVDRVFEQFRPEVVYHLAAQIDVRRSVDRPVDDATTNVLGTINMLEAAARTGVKRFVFTSSAAVYGSAGIGGQVGPETPYWPISPYGASKLAAEGYVTMWDRLTTLQGVNTADPVAGVTGSMSCTTVRLSNVYGPRQREGVGAVNIFARRLLTGKPVTLYGDGGNVRDYVYVADVARALAWAGNCLTGSRAARAPQVLVGSGVGTTDHALFLAVLAEVSRQLPDGTPGERLFTRAASRPEDIRAMVFPASPMARTPFGHGISLVVEHLRKELGL